MFPLNSTGRLQVSCGTVEAGFKGGGRGEETGSQSMQFREEEDNLSPPPLLLLHPANEDQGCTPLHLKARRAERRGTIAVTATKKKNEGNTRYKTNKQANDGQTAKGSRGETVAFHWFWGTSFALSFLVLLF